MNIKKTVFIILLSFVALTEAINSYIRCKKIEERCSCPDFLKEENMVCASNGKTYQNK